MTTRMRAVRQYEFGGPEVLTFDEIDIPNPLPTEVQVQVHFAGVNPVDAKTRIGASAAVAMDGFPFRIGWDVAGVVSKLGAGVTRFAVGDRVFGMPWFPRECGAYAEYVTAPSRQLVKVPDNLDLASAAAVPLPATTAFQALFDVAEVKPGQTVVILGASGTVGRFAVQIAKSMGAAVTATARGEKVRELEALGADRVVDSDRDVLGQVSTDADLVIDLVGGEFSASAIDLVRPGGLVLSIPSGDKSELQSRASSAGKRLTGMIVEPDRQSLEHVAMLIKDGQVVVPKPVVFDLEEAIEVHMRLETGSGKMVLRVAARD